MTSNIAVLPMLKQSVKSSPRLTARLAGLLSLLTILAGMFAEMFVSDKLIVSADAAATATNILAHKSLFQFGFAAYLIEMTCSIAVVVFFYNLLKPVSRNISLLAAFLGLTGCIIKIFSRLFFITPLLILGGGHYLSVFNPEQVQALALLLLKINVQGAGMALVFSGFYTLLNGYLILRSTFLPRILGVLDIIGGLGWLSFLYAPLADQLFTYILAFALLGSVVEILWLLVVGVDVPKWEKRAAEAG